MTESTLINPTNEIEALQQGCLIVYPTEAVWGIGCDPDNEDAVMKLLEAKQRPVEKGLILVAQNLSQCHDYFDFDKVPIEKRPEIFSSWPGPVTWLLPAKASAPKWITGGSDMIAIRISAHPTIQRICRTFNKPIVSTSANRTTEPVCKNLAEAIKVFGSQVAIYVDEALGGSEKPSVIKHSITGEVFRS
ncbi:L-threonylcarbamoyladenylate synthase type 1 TsaC [Psychrosphaera aestuarii]|uniref:Sua5/YciO/YrdC/YwlC family protein n=1 Tax=Psychrosphaera aestuarii TaxID=1266052 RepID=UPI001B338F23|nr:Sua5/YciO/YrdC/YwlC family protein [Psychrosphaera aestuarii]